MIKILQFVSIVLTAISMSAGWAHLLEMPNKMTLARDEYLVVQQIYSGWALLGIAVVGALASTTAVTVMLRGAGAPFYFSLLATVFIASSLAVFFSVTYPTNVATRNWTVLPDNWATLRTRWEYSHAVGAILYLLALSSLVLALIVGRR